MRDYNVISFGALQDGEAAANRKAIQCAIDAASVTGGRVVVPEGIWPCGSLELKSHVELHVCRKAILVGSLKSEDYNGNEDFFGNIWSEGEEWSGGHLLYAHDAEDIAVTGEGTIDGSGPAFFGDCDETCRFPYYKYGLKLKPLDREWYRPGLMVAFFRCKNIRLEDITLKDTPCWTVHIRCSEGVIVRKVKIKADVTIANSDGISIDCTRNVLIQDCDICTGDDAIALRASCEHHHDTNFCERIRIENCDIRSCCFGIRFGVGSGTVRNVDFINNRIYESSIGIGFTPASSRSSKDVTIEDIRISGCLVRESGRPLAGGIVGNGVIRNVEVKDCDFEALEPCELKGIQDYPVENVRFINCVFRQLKRLKTCYDLRWDEEHKQRCRQFLESNEHCRNISIANCLPGNLDEKGVLLLSFDDRSFSGWLAALPLFEKYNAHGTFFVSGDIDNEAVKVMKTLSNAGHSVGLHGLHHQNADEGIAELGAEGYYAADIIPQTDRVAGAYLPYTSFAYPNCRHTKEADELFYSKGFLRVRAGVPGATPFDPKGEKQSSRRPLPTNDAVFFPASELARHRCIDTIIVGEAYHTDINEIIACLKRASERHEVISITSHDIAPDATFISMKTEWLEQILACAQAFGLAVIGYDELPFPEN